MLAEAWFPPLQLSFAPGRHEYKTACPDSLLSSRSEIPIQYAELKVNIGLEPPNRC